LISHAMKRCVLRARAAHSYYFNKSRQAQQW
jgi:hypothetical protein